MSKPPNLLAFIKSQCSIKGMTLSSLAEAAGYNSLQTLHAKFTSGFFGKNAIEDLTAIADILRLSESERKSLFLCNKKTLSENFRITPHNVVTETMISGGLKDVIRVLAEERLMTFTELARNSGFNSKEALNQMLSNGANTNKTRSKLANICAALELTPEEVNYVLLANKCTPSQRTRN